ncbi:DNA repair protein RecO [Roseburia hominis]
MVLSASPIGEYDKRIVILTKERGKLSAFAKGARRPQSHLAGVTTPCSFGTFALYEGRTSYTVQSAEISNYFAELRGDVEAAYYAFYFLEFADYYAREANDERELLKLLYQTMRVLTKRVVPLKLVRYIYELKAISINGEGPQVFQCVVCGNRERSSMFSVKKGGLVCGECDRDVYDGMRLNTSTLYAMQYVVSSPVEKLYTFRLSDEVQGEFGRVMERYMDVYVDRRFKSLEILEQIVGMK